MLVKIAVTVGQKQDQICQRSRRTFSTLSDDDGEHIPSKPQQEDLLLACCYWIITVFLSCVGRSYLFGRQDRDVVLVDGASFFLHKILVVFLFQVFTGQPEQHVLLAVLGAQELPENVPTCRVPHQLLKRLGPHLDLLRGGLCAVCPSIHIHRGGNYSVMFPAT